MLLTLAIPTYNRAESLRGTLLNFLQQIEQQELHDIEIIVSDNCSTDITGSVCASVASIHPSVPVRYFRNSSNLGFDGNVDAIYRRASGKYVWTFSDDDSPASNAVATVLKLLRQHDVRFAYVNYQVSVDGHLLPSRFGTGPDRCLKARDILKTIRFSNSLVSSCIFLREAWIAADAQKLVGTLWIHFFIAREILQTGDGLVIGRPLFTMMQSGLEKSRAEKLQVNSDEVEFYMLAHLKFVEFAKALHHYDFDHETVVLAHNLGKREDIHQVVNFKLTAPKYSVAQLSNTWKQMARFRKSETQFWLVVTPLLIAPCWAFKLARVVYRISKSWLR